MGRSYLTVRVLVLTVSCLVVLEYMSLLQSAENADKIRPSIFCLLDEHGAKHTNILQLFPRDFYSTDLLTMDNNSSNLFLPPKEIVPIHHIAVNRSNLPECPMIPPNLQGKFNVETDEVPDFSDLETMFPLLDSGGRYSPRDCRARHRVAIIVPYRDRADHLKAFLFNIHRFLQRQQSEYGIFVVEQSGKGPFNRAMLMNVGAAEAIKQYDYQCFIFHDVDLMPEDDRNLYTCPIQPRHMSVSIDKFQYRLPYDEIFGGVSAMTVDQFRLVNGFSNLFWGWGGEDDDMANRLRLKKLFISRYPANIARYKMLKHGAEKANPERFKYLYSGAKRISKDGYNSLKYRKIELELKRLYTWILVELPKLKP
eukprot:TRINITY_DN16472_c0_g1_i10.p1 TRINITY_DN16472_c0_g1~~TRINITY_DN16472_c0_g1_i10.p1  ORF type:complete len:367 (-),score=51.58 TRINITY_DN16472_c0_g1_i10:446-1546(-)